MEFEMFNIFGTVRLERNRVHVFGSAVRSDNQRSVEKSFSEDLEEAVEGIEPGENLVVLFAVRLGDGEKNRIFVQNLSGRANGGNLYVPEDAKTAVKKVVKMF